MRDNRRLGAGSEFFSSRLIRRDIYLTLFFPIPLRWIATKVIVIELGRATKEVAQEEGVKEGERPMTATLPTSA
jgi:hypothetical protein